jgi:cobalt-zinc-cadmium efflux system membrane fusion protein
MKSQWISLTALVLLAGAACTGTSATNATPAAGEPKTAESTEEKNAVRANGDLQKKWGIGLGQATRASVVAAIVIPGTLGLDPQRTARISSLLDGQVIFVGVRAGDEVRRGQALVTIHAPALAHAKTAYLLAGARLELARREMERADVLLKQEAIDRREHLRRRAEFENASIEFAVAESNLHSYGLDQAAVERLLRDARQPRTGTAAMDDLAEPYLALTAPMAGHVIDQNAINGQHVEPQQTLMTIADLSTLWAVLDAREADLPHVGRGQAVRVTTSVYPDRAWQGRVDHVGDVVDEKTRTVQVRVVVPNGDRLLKPNMYVRGELPDAVSARDVLTLPEEAVQTISGEPVVFVRQGADRVGARRTVTRGLDGSEAVVTAGAFNLKAELLKSTLGGE